MEHILTALIPIFALIVIGYGFKRMAFPAEGFWPMADKFTYYILMPSLLIFKLSTAKLDGADTFNVVYVGLLSITLMLVLALFVQKLFSFEGPSFTSIAQGAFRFNTYVFLALVDAMFGDKGLVLAAILITFAIPLINLYCIGVFALFSEKGKPTFKAFVLSIIKNPLIVACFIGGFINFTSMPFPVPLERTFEILSRAALPLGLLSIGVGLELRHLGSAKKELMTAQILKLLVFPVVIFVVAKLFSLSSFALMIVVLFGAMPTAPSSYILARELGGDLKLMSSIVTLQTLLSMLSIAGVIQVLLYI